MSQLTRRWAESIRRSSRKPSRPMVTTPTRMRASDCELPFWNSSQTNFPRPGFCASISVAISTIQPMPSDTRMPANTIGTALGSTTRRTRVSHGRRSTRVSCVSS